MALIIYFMCKIFNAEMKLVEGRIGTMITTIQSDTVQGNYMIVIVAPKTVHVPSFMYFKPTNSWFSLSQGRFGVTMIQFVFSILLSLCVLQKKRML